MEIIQWQQIKLAAVTAQERRHGQSMPVHAAKQAMTPGKKPKSTVYTAGSQNPCVPQSSLQTQILLFTITF